jgi:predicted RNA binding protein YcfA (HicA-like mRNA interferase family)
MSALDSKTTLKNLKKKGFKEVPGDHKRLELYYRGKFVSHTKISHSNSDIDNYLIKQMSVQCNLDKEQFIDLAKCPLSKEEYFKILEEKGLLN